MPIQVHHSIRIAIQHLRHAEEYLLHAYGEGTHAMVFLKDIKPF